MESISPSKQTKLTEKLTELEKESTSIPNKLAKITETQRTSFSEESDYSVRTVINWIKWNSPEQKLKI